MLLRERAYGQTRVAAGSVAPVGCTECHANINWANADPRACDAHRADWNFYCKAYGPNPNGQGVVCMNCVYAASSEIVRDFVCTSGTRPPDRVCGAQGCTPTEVQVNEKDFPKLDIFEKWPSSK